MLFSLGHNSFSFSQKAVQRNRGARELHYTPTYASWLNQVELWFAKVKRDLLGRGIFTSVTDLARKLRRFITKYNERAKPVRWAYADPSRRIA